jgi:hypothetical protein
MTIRVELQSPYGALKVPDGRCLINGSRGWTTGEYDGQKPYVKFGTIRSKSLPIAVPAHWIVSVIRKH